MKNLYKFSKIEMSSRLGMISAGTILVMDDDVEIRRLVLKILGPAGYKVKIAERPRDILRQVFSTRCSLVILDVEAINASSLRILKELRAWSTVPVILISSLLPEKDILAASLAGANDYVTKPFSHMELLTSVRLALRSANTIDQKITYETNSVTIDFENHRVSKKDKVVNLTPTEFSLLSLFVHNAGKLLTHDCILRRIRGPWFEDKKTYSRVYTGRLRRKLEDDPDHPQMFQTEPGRGYRFIVQR